MRILTSEVIFDIKSAAWLESELHPELDSHRRHEMADICEAANIDRVWRVLGVAGSEIRLAIRRILRKSGAHCEDNSLSCPEAYRFEMRHHLPEALYAYIKEKIHEYLVARVMGDRMSVIIPRSAAIWEERGREAYSCLVQAAATAGRAKGRVRRPLWPL